MGRHASETWIRMAVRLLRLHPGRRSSDYARMMDCHRESFVRVLTQLEDRGVLVSEDRQGRLWLPAAASRAHDI